ncbi:hypothetical protein ABVT39_018968 [Epinephelus coioides]
MSCGKNTKTPLDSLKDNDSIDLHQEQTDADCNFYAMTVNLQASIEQLKTLHQEIHTMKRQFRSCIISEGEYDVVKAEERSARKIYVSLQRQVKVLTDKVQCQCNIYETYKTTNGSNEVMDLHCHSHDQSFQDLKDKLSTFDNVQADCDAKRKNNMQNIKELQDLEKEKEELCAAVQHQEEAMTC